MKVVYLAHEFSLPDTPGALRAFRFCTHLVENGHSVVAITSSVRYRTGSVRPEHRGKLLSSETIDGVKVIYVYSYPNFKGSFRRRIPYYLSFMLMALATGCFVRGTDIIYTSSPPLTTILAGYCLAQVNRLPLVLEIGDIWPDGPVEVGVLTDPGIVKLSACAANICYERAAKIVVLTQGIGDALVKKGVPVEKVALITNGVDDEFFDLADHEQRGISIREQLGLSDRFVCLYLGAHGIYNSLWTIIEAAEILKDEPRYAFVFVGDGDDKPRLQKMAETKGLANTCFLPPQQRQDTLAYLQVADIFLLPNRKGDFYKMNLPSKLFDFLASGRPIVVAGEGETADLVSQASAGVIVPAEDAPAMAVAIRQLSNLGAEERQVMGASGAAYVRTHYKRRDQAKRFEDVLLSSLSKRKRAETTSRCETSDPPHVGKKH